MSPFIEAGNAFLPSPDIALFDTEEFVDEAAGFPNAAHDDQVDAASQALAELLLDGTGAQAWIAWAKRKAEEAAAGQHPAEPGHNGHQGGSANGPAPPPEPGEAPEILTPEEARRRARDEAYRAQQREGAGWR